MQVSLYSKYRVIPTARQSIQLAGNAKSRNRKHDLSETYNQFLRFDLLDHRFPNLWPANGLWMVVDGFYSMHLFLFIRRSFSHNICL